MTRCWCAEISIDAGQRRQESVLLHRTGQPGAVRLHQLAGDRRFPRPGTPARVLDRIRAGPVRTSAILLGFGLSRLGFTLLQSMLLIGVGALIFGVSLGDPLGVALVVLAFALVCTGAGLLVGSLARNGEQALAIGIPTAIALGMLGGAMWPLEIVGSAMRTAGHATPHALSLIHI